jgi:hypothetical protein
MATKKKPVPAMQKQQVNTNKPVEIISQPKPQPKPVTYGKPKAPESASLDFAFGKMNYILMIAGIVIIALGFILMIGGGSKDPKVFSNDIFDTQRMTVAPLLVLAGFAVEIFAILKKPRTV